MRYVLDYVDDSFDEPAQYMVRDTKHANRVVARFFLSDYTVGDQKTVIDHRKAVLQGELAALDMAKLIAEKLEVAAENGEVL